MDIKIEITPDILRLISELDQFNSEWKYVTGLSPHLLESLQKVATIESVASSTRIEGSKLTDKEVELLLANLSTYSFQSRDEEEVAGYAEVMNTIIPFYKDIFFTENYIKQLHSTLLKHTLKDVRHRGEYKKVSNNVVAYDAQGKEVGIIFETTTPFETPIQMHALISWTRQNLEEKYYHPLIVIGIFIVSFLAIHPFQDGNGRLSRVLTTLLLLQQGYQYVIYSSLESVIELNKKEYYSALRATQISFNKEQQNWEPWLLFFLRALQKQKNNLVTKINKPIISTDNIPEGANHITEKELQILQLLQHQRRLTLEKVTFLININRNTAKKSLQRLVNKNLVQLNGKGRGSWYSLPNKIDFFKDK